LEEPQHIDCLRNRLIGTIAMPGSYEIQVLHVTCVHEPTAFGGIGLHVARDFSADPDDSSDEAAEEADDPPDEAAGEAAGEGPDESSPKGISVLLTIGSALVLANRIQAAVNAALAVGEEPIDADRAIAQMLASDTD
jgi:hypothetical protein